MNIEDKIQFDDILDKIKKSCERTFGSGATNLLDKDILQAATKIYLVEKYRKKE